MLNLEVQHSREVVFADRLSYSGLQYGVNTLAVGEIDFCFCRMDIDIDIGRVHFQKKEVGWEGILRDKFLEGSLHCMMKVGIADKPSVCKKVLFSPGFFGEFGFAYKPADVHHHCVRLHRNQALVI